jgi:transketolase
MFAGKNNLHNLTAIIDRNNIQIDGYTEDIMPLEPLAEKLYTFNFHVIEIDGHDFIEINSAVSRAKAIFNKPSAIIAHTIPGKGVDFMERRYEWHGVPPGDGPEDVYKKDRQAEEALKSLRTFRGKINCIDC